MQTYIHARTPAQRAKLGSAALAVHILQFSTVERARVDPDGCVQRSPCF